MKINIEYQLNATYMVWFLYPEIIEFCKTIHKKDLHATLSILDAGYDSIDNGCYGYIGSTGSDELNEEIIKSPVPKNLEILNFTYKILNDWLTEERKELLNKIYVRCDGRNNKIKMWNIVNTNEKYKYKVAYYKKPFFDEFYQIYKSYVLDGKEEDLIYIKDRNFNMKFIDFLDNLPMDYIPTNNCLLIETKNSSKETNFSILTFGTTVEDLEKNKEILLQIISEL